MVVVVVVVVVMVVVMVVVVVVVVVMVMVVVVLVVMTAWLVARGARPGTPRNSRKILVFGRPEIVKNFTFWLSDPTFKPGIGTGIAENPPYLILRSRG